MANGGYVIIDLGLTEEEFLEAMSTKQFNGTKEQYDIIANAIKSGKPLVLTIPLLGETINLIATPVMTKDNGELSEVGFMTQPGLFNGIPMSILFRMSPETYIANIYILTLNTD